MKPSAITAAATGLVALVTVSCTTITRTLSNSSGTNVSASSEEHLAIRKGMSTERLRELWGAPREMIPDAMTIGRQVWVYERADAVGADGRSVVTRAQYRITVQDGKVTEVEEKLL